MSYYFNSTCDECGCKKPVVIGFGDDGYTGDTLGFCLDCLEAQEVRIAGYYVLRLFDENGKTIQTCLIQDYGVMDSEYFPWYVDMQVFMGEITDQNCNNPIEFRMYEGESFPIR